MEDMVSQTAIDTISDQDIKEVLEAAVEIINRPEESTILSKFKEIDAKLDKLITYAGNKYVFEMKRTNHKLGYLDVEDIRQELKLIMWGICNKNPNKPIEDLIKISKTMIWRIIAHFFRTSNLRKNRGYHSVLYSREDGDAEHSMDDMLQSQVAATRKHDLKDFWCAPCNMPELENMDFNFMKLEFLKYLLNFADATDIRIYKLIAFPETEEDFLNFCYTSNSIKKKRHIKVISQTNIAKYMNVSNCHLHNKIKKLGTLYSAFKKEKQIE
jgi:hypothetical protein